MAPSVWIHIWYDWSLTCTHVCIMPTSFLRLAACLSPFFAAACSGTISGGQPSADAGVPEADAALSQRVVCGYLDEGLESVTPTVQLVVDRSWSMGADMGGMSRWDAVRTALLDEDRGAVVRHNADVRFGATFYTSHADAGVCPLLEEIEPARFNRAEIAHAFADYGPLGHTPTGESLRLASERLHAFPEEGPKAMVLATDGLPDTCATPHPNNTPGAYQAVLEAAEAAYAKGIATIVLSVGPEVATSHLQDVANAGGGVGADDAAAPFYVALDPESLSQAFADIIDGVRSCTYSVETLSDVTRGEEGLRLTDGFILLDNLLLEQDVDWRIRGADTVEFLGRACQLLKGGPHELYGKFYCQGEIL